MKLIPPPAHVAQGGALLLDFDGTLVPIAARPDAVWVDPALRDLLRALVVRLSGALAIVSGRSLASLDGLLAPLVLPAAGEHGVALRPNPQRPPVRANVPRLRPEWRKAVKALAARHPGALVEEKPAGLVLHYREAPAAGSALWAGMRTLFGATQGFALADASMAIELRPRGIGKGDAVRTLMAEAPFAGRMPIFVGDDVTDEDGIAAARALGGIGLRMDSSFCTPAGLARWLAAIAATHAPAA